MLLLCISGRLLGNGDCGETFFTVAHTHWNTITGEWLSHLKYFVKFCIHSYDKMEFDG